jgi:hypothetical protein
MAFLLLQIVAYGCQLLVFQNSFILPFGAILWSIMSANLPQPHAQYLFSGLARYAALARSHFKSYPRARADGLDASLAARLATWQEHIWPLGTFFPHPQILGARIAMSIVLAERPVKFLTHIHEHLPFNPPDAVIIDRDD